jgi:Putative prokaryotic signal transducing protein
LELLVRTDRISAYVLRDIFAMHGIKTHVLNEYMQGAIGELPVDAAMPQVWLDDGSDRPRATEVLRQFNVQRNRTGSLFCRACKEENPATFETCWSCSVAL